MNQKNPGLAELEPTTKEEERDFYRYYAIGWTIAAGLYTTYAIWQRSGHHSGTVIFGWLMAALGWVVCWYERRKRDSSAKL